MTNDDEKHERWFWVMTIVGVVFYLIVIHVFLPRGV